MLQMLLKFPQREFPGDYLMSRLRYKRTLFVSEAQTEEYRGEVPEVFDADIWARELEERKWLFRQMNGRLRDTLAPLFLYFEINTLVQCLRFLEAGRFDEIDPLLDRSLLSAELKKILRHKSGPADAIAGLERFSRNSSLVLKGFVSAYNDRGIQGCEELIRRNFLEQSLQTCTDPDITAFLRDMVDLKNTLAVAKCVRWGRESAPEVVAGGRIRAKVIAQSVTGEGLRQMVKRWTKEDVITDEQLLPVNLEPALYARLLLKMARARRVAGEVVVCIEYILHSFLMSRNRSLLLHAKGPGEKGYMSEGPVS